MIEGFPSFLAASCHPKKHILYRPSISFLVFLHLDMTSIHSKFHLHIQGCKFLYFRLIADFSTLKALKNQFQLYNTSLFDLIITSDFQKIHVYCFRMFFINPNLHPWIEINEGYYVINCVRYPNMKNHYRPWIPCYCLLVRLKL